ncbi:hypothetical protein, partial [Streptomyces neyagawaensis]|uniref:hypothetical protein n=1 Tax=Streptomyces neyagawaensis TaxID=42238 RepID=UPI000AE8D8E2
MDRAVEAPGVRRGMVDLTVALDGVCDVVGSVPGGVRARDLAGLRPVVSAGALIAARPATGSA